MHEAALRGGAREPLSTAGCFLGGIGAIAVLALRGTPGVYPAAALCLLGLAGPLRRMGERLGARAGPTARLLGFGAPAAALAAGLPAVLTLEPVPMRLFWAGAYAAAGAFLWAAAADLSYREERLADVRGLSPARLEAAALEIAAAGPRGARRELLLLASERLLAEGDAGRAARVLRLVSRPVPAPAARRLRRLESGVAFLEGDLEAARRAARELLSGPLDLEEGRQFRAWAAYLELAAGRPGAAAALAVEALGPHAIAGEQWHEHCAALRCWAMLERGETRDVVEAARRALAAASPGSPYRSALHSLLGRAHLYLGEVEPARKLSRDAPAESARGDSMAWGLECRLHAREGHAAAAAEAGAAALAAAVGPFARALARVDAGHALLSLGETEAAEEQFRLALHCWSWLPEAEEGRARAAARRGEAEEAARLRAAAARRYPEHRVALAGPGSTLEG